MHKLLIWIFNLGIKSCFNWQWQPISAVWSYFLTALSDGQANFYGNFFPFFISWNLSMKTAFTGYRNVFVSSLKHWKMRCNSLFQVLDWVCKDNDKNKRPTSQHGSNNNRNSLNVSSDSSSSSSSECSAKLENKIVLHVCPGLSL